MSVAVSCRVLLMLHSSFSFCTSLMRSCPFSATMWQCTAIWRCHNLILLIHYTFLSCCHSSVIALLDFFIVKIHKCFMCCTRSVYTLTVVSQLHCCHIYTQYSLLLISHNTSLVVLFHFYCGFLKTFFIFNCCRSQHFSPQFSCFSKICGMRGGHNSTCAIL